MAKKRGLTPLNLIVLLLALAFVMQTCSPAGPDYDDLPPFPPAPGASGAITNFLTGQVVQTTPQVTVVNDGKAFFIGTAGTVIPGREVPIKVHFEPADNEVWAVYRTIYLDGTDTGQKVDNTFPRKTSDYTIVDSSNYLDATGSFDYTFSKTGVHKFQITAYKLVGNDWEYPDYHVFEFVINIAECYPGQNTCLNSGEMEVCSCTGKKSKVSCFLCTQGDQVTTSDVCLSAPGVQNTQVPNCPAGTVTTTVKPTTTTTPPPPTPTCSDVIKNQDETGIDCGGTICNACAAPKTGAASITGGQLIDCWIDRGLVHSSSPGGTCTQPNCPCTPNACATGEVDFGVMNEYNELGRYYNGERMCVKGTNVKGSLVTCVYTQGQAKCNLPACPTGTILQDDFEEIRGFGLYQVNNPTVRTRTGAYVERIGICSNANIQVETCNDGASKSRVCATKAPSGTTRLFGSSTPPEFIDIDWYANWKTTWRYFYRYDFYS